MVFYRQFARGPLCYGLDALILGYSWAATIPLLAMRALSGLVSATVISIINIPLLRAIRKLSPNED